jgi:hypothetical protein
MEHNNFYISQLNMEFPPAIKDDSLTDLSSFTNSSFFDFDQFNEESEKLNYQQQFHQQLASVEVPSSSINDFTSTGDLDDLNYLEKHVDETLLYQQAAAAAALPLAKVTTKQEDESAAQFQFSSQVSTPASHLDNLSSSDKKKRNTAASARFRIKKKLREEEMERTLKDLNERVSKYNSRIQQLEMENKCLKSLILQKNEQRSNDLLRSIKERSMNSQL